MQVTLNALPASLAEFRNLSLNTPDEVVAGFLCALNLYVKNPNEGVEAMNLLRGPRPMTPYDSQFLRDRLRARNICRWRILPEPRLRTAMCLPSLMC